MGADRDWAMLVVWCLAALLAGLLEVLFVPFYVGSLLAPVVVPIALVANAFWTRWGFRMVPSTVGAVAPFVAWLVPVLGVAVVVRPEGDVIIAGGGGQQYVYYALLLLGCLSGLVAIVVITNDAKLAQRRRDGPATPTGQPTVSR